VSWRHRLPALAAVAFGAATLTAFWLSVKVGLFGFRESATGSAQVLAEGAAICRDRFRHRRRFYELAVAYPLQPR
jgi:hypothetical protein